MIFYEDFIKSVENANVVPKEREKFIAETKKMVAGLGVGIPLILVSIFQLYTAKFDGSIFRIIFGVIFLYIGFKQLKHLFSYKVILDRKERKLRVTNMELTFDEIETATLKEGKLGKNIEVVIDIITKDKRQFIVPLYMNKKVRFVSSLKDELKEKFIIKKN